MGFNLPWLVHIVQRELPNFQQHVLGVPCDYVESVAVLHVAGTVQVIPHPDQVSQNHRNPAGPGKSTRTSRVTGEREGLGPVPASVPPGSSLCKPVYTQTWSGTYAEPASRRNPARGGVYGRLCIGLPPDVSVGLQW